MRTGLAALPFGYVFLVAYWTVLVAELGGDKAVYAVASLALRFRAGIVFRVMTVAFAGKMFAVVLLGSTIARVPSQWTAILSAVAFFSSGLFIWFKEPESLPRELPVSALWSRTTGIAFASLFFTEWGDPGQISAAALTAQSQSSLATWLGGTLAMITKGGLALAIGLTFRDRLPLRMLRALASASCCVLGILALRELVFP